MATAKAIARPHFGKAAAYARMSTNHQKFSIANQLDAIETYAADHDLEIVQTYLDEGKSGLRLVNRPGLRQLLEDVVSGHANYESLLVYDVSRWGRFQDADESAHYEFMCRSNGVHVNYCAEQFINDGSTFSTLIKGVKRAMAAEYSRELAAKVTAGRIRVAKLGFHVGAPAAVGLRRLMVDEHRQPITLLEKYQHKSITTARIVLVHGPPSEVALVQRIFHMFLEENLGFNLIARTLNAEGILTPHSCKWRAQAISHVLRSEYYAGCAVYNRVSNPLRTGRVSNPPERWVKVRAAVEPIIDQSTFDRVQKKIASAFWRQTNEQLLDHLRAYLKRHGRLTVDLLRSEESLPNYSLIRKRFGSAEEVYSLIGHKSTRPTLRAGNLKRAYSCRRRVAQFILDFAKRAGLPAKMDSVTNTLWVNGQSIHLIVTSIAEDSGGRERWQLRLRPYIAAEMVLVVRLDWEGPDPLDFYLFQRRAWPLTKYYLRREPTQPLDDHRLLAIGQVCARLANPTV